MASVLPVVRASMVSLFFLVFFSSVLGFKGEVSMGLSVEWVINISEVCPGEVGHGYYGYKSGQTVWDMDGDGIKEIVFATSRLSPEKRFWCFDANGRLEWVYPHLDEEGLPGNPYSKASLVDVDSDGVEELCFGDFSGRLHVLRGDGTALWTWDTPEPEGSINGAPQALDVDGDGFVEFFIHEKHGRVHRVSHEGRLVWTSAQAYRGGEYAQPTICDLDKDGSYEVLWNPYHGNIYCTDAVTGLNRWVYEGSTNPPVIVADVDRDGEYEIIAWNELPPGVLCLNFIGEEIWRWDLSVGEEIFGRIRMCQSMGDVDGDGRMDLVLISEPGIYCLDIGGEDVEVKWFINITAWSEEGKLPPGAISRYQDSYQLIVDFDGDGELEILWLVPYPVVTDAATGGLEAFYWHENLLLNFSAQNGGWWGDVDDDGVSEWICELREWGSGSPWLGGRVYCLTMDGEFPSRSTWPEFFHCAYPAKYQAQQDWLALKSAYSNSLWFPAPDLFAVASPALFCLALYRRKQRLHPTTWI